MEQPPPLERSLGSTDESIAGSKGIQLNHKSAFMGAYPQEGASRQQYGFYDLEKTRPSSKDGDRPIGFDFDFVPVFDRGQEFIAKTIDGD